MTDALDVLEFLESHDRTPEVTRAWRAFMRACTTELVDHWSQEARAWCEVADAFDDGRLDEAELSRVRAAAWPVCDRIRGPGTERDYSLHRAALFRLHPRVEAGRLVEEAFHFRRFCDDLGLDHDRQWEIMRRTMLETALRLGLPR